MIAKFSQVPSDEREEKYSKSHQFSLIENKESHIYLYFIEDEDDNRKETNK